MATKKTAEPVVNYDSAQEIINLGQQFVKVINDCKAAQVNFEDKLKGLEASEMVLARKSNELDKREAEIKTREIAIKPREVELSSKISHIETVEEAQRRMVEADTKDAKAKQMMKDVQVKLQEVQVREEQLHADQLVLSQEKENYKKQVREEILANFLK